MFRFLFWVLVYGAIQIEGANILMIFHAIQRSHYILGEALGLGLAQRGHEVTMISPYRTSDKHENYTEIVLHDAFDTLFAKMFLKNVFNSGMESNIKTISHMTSIGVDSANRTFFHPDVQKLIKSGKKFDIFISEVMLNEGLLGMAHHLNATTVMVSTLGTSTWTNKMVGNPFNPSYNINFMLPYANPLTFLERLASTAFTLVDELFYWLHINRQDEMYQEHYRSLNGGRIENKPDLMSLIANVSLVLLNTNIVVGNAQAFVPNMIPVGGFHVKPKKLPADLQKLLDESTQGVVYFSMGSNLKSKDLPAEKREAILKTFAKLNQIVLWKWEDDSLPNQPTNVIIKRWMPQQAILAHPNVKVFITHGGLLSSIEALYFGKPLIGIPVFGDQHMNMARATRSGYGIQLLLDEINEDTLTEALSKALNEPSHRLKAQYLSKIFRDENQAPLEKAISAIEYVHRHNGAPFLRSPSTGMPFYQRMLLDVVAALLCIISLPLLCLYWVTRKMLRTFCKCCNKSDLKKKNL